MFFVIGAEILINHLVYPLKALSIFSLQWINIEKLKTGYFFAWNNYLIYYSIVYIVASERAEQQINEATTSFTTVPLIQVIFKLQSDIKNNNLSKYLAGSLGHLALFQSVGGTIPESSSCIDSALFVSLNGKVQQVTWNTTVN